MKKTDRKFKKFAVSSEDVERISKDVIFLEHKYREKFNFSRFHRLCSRHMRDEDFLLQIGYFHTPNDINKTIGDALFPKF